MYIIQPLCSILFIISCLSIPSIPSIPLSSILSSPHHMTRRKGKRKASPSPSASSSAIDSGDAHLHISGRVVALQHKSRRLHWLKWQVSPSQTLHRRVWLALPLLSIMPISRLPGLKQVVVFAQAHHQGFAFQITNPKMKERCAFLFSLQNIDKLTWILH